MVEVAYVDEGVGSDERVIVPGDQHGEIVGRVALKINIIACYAIDSAGGSRTTHRGGEAHRTPYITRLIAAHGDHIDGVLGVGVEVGEGIGEVGDGVMVGVGGIGQVVDDIAVGGAIPAEGGAGGGDIAYRQISNSQAGGAGSLKGVHLVVGQGTAVADGVDRAVGVRYLEAAFVGIRASNPSEGHRGGAADAVFGGHLVSILDSEMAEGYSVLFHSDGVAVPAVAVAVVTHDGDDAGIAVACGNDTTFDGVGLIGGGAVGIDGEVVGRHGAEAGDVECGRGGLVCADKAVANRSDIYHIGGTFVDGVSPSEGDAFGGDIADVQVAHREAGGRGGDFDRPVDRNIAVRVLCHHIEGIGGVRVEAGDGGRGLVHQRVVNVVGDEVGGAVGIVVLVRPTQGDAVGGDAVDGQVADGVDGGSLGHGEVVDMQVVVATTGRLGVEGDADGAAHKLGEVHRLLDILGAGNLGQGVLAALVLPLGGVGFGPGVTAIGGDEDHEGLVVIVGGGVVAAVGGEGCVEIEHGCRSLRQVDLRRYQPFLIGAVNIDFIVVGFNSVAFAAGKLPGVGSVELKGVAVEYVGGSHGGVSIPAGIVVDRGLEALLPRIGHGGAGRAGGDSCHFAIVITAVGIDTEGMLCVGLEVEEGVGGVGIIAQIDAVELQPIGADTLGTVPGEGDSVGGDFDYLQVVDREAGNAGLEAHRYRAPATIAIVVGAGDHDFVVVQRVGLQVGYHGAVGFVRLNRVFAIQALGPEAEGVGGDCADGGVGHGMQCGVCGADVGGWQRGRHAARRQCLELALGEVAVVAVAAHGTDVEVVVGIGIQVD